ncbi:glycosyltransferase [Desulfonatronum thioautotrophicum]|uniref:glycosyltransferase n=1 Tax=Desulfonatronum thioautotrophicum TaxID=617001 RepID=UPI0005EBEEBC|nr:glycosyltransferase [Desulfonatronum thioautotrophicum]
MTREGATPGRISIILVTYNHERYVGRALRSLAGQIVDREVEVVVADDASTDATMEIVRAFAREHPQWPFRFLDNAVNLGITRNYQRAFAACTGEYVAVLEGDDYWISPWKLARQCAFLDAHWECDLCSVNYFVYEQHAARFTPRTAVGSVSGSGHRLLGARDLIADNLVGNFSTCMYRKTALDALPPALFDLVSYDWIVNICVARTGLIGFLERPMSVYRLHEGGVWSRKSPEEQVREQIALIRDYDALTGHVFSAEFQALTDVLHRRAAARFLTERVGGAARFSPGWPSRFAEYLPPVLLSAARALLPPRLHRFLSGKAGSEGS